MIGRKIQNKKEFDDVLVERQQKKVIRYYVIWTIVYLPLTILGFYKAGDGFVKSFVQFIRNVFFKEKIIIHGLYGIFCRQYMA